jgi:carbon storage regulator CsrA
MLVLSRKSQESVVVGDCGSSECLLKVTVLEISTGRVQLGFEASKEVPIYRWELWQEIRAKDPPVSPIMPPAGKG